MNNFCQQKFVEKEIRIGADTKNVRFYAIPYGTILKMKSLGKSASKLITVLMTDTTKDVETEIMTAVSDQRDSVGDAYTNSHQIQKELSPSMASLRQRQTEEAVAGLVDALFSDDVQDLVSEIIVRSAKDEFTESDKAEIKDNMDLETLIWYLRGALEASAGGIAGLGKFLSPQMQERVSAVVGSVQEKVKTKAP